MKALELVGDIDEQHRLRAQVPEGLPAGPVRLIVLLPEEDEGGGAWGTASPRNGRTNCATHDRTSTPSKMGNP